MASTSKKELIEKYILSEISSGKLKEGNQLMTEYELCEKFDVSRMTVRAAMTDLANKGYIVRTPGKGTFVARRTYLRNISYRRSFTKDMASIGKVAGSKTLEFHKGMASKYPKAISELLMSEFDEVYYFVRLRTGDNEPFAVQYSYVPARLVSNFDLGALDGSLDEYLSSKGLQASSYETKLSAVMATEMQEKLLDLPKNSPLLESRTYRYLSDGSIYEYTETYYRADRYEYTFSSNLKRDE